MQLQADVSPHCPHTDFKGKITPAFSFGRGILRRFPSLIGCGVFVACWYWAETAWLSSTLVL